MELTKKELEQILDQKLDKQTKELKQFAEDQTEHLARLISDSVVKPLGEQIEDLEKKVNVKPRVEKLEKQMTEMRSALHLT